MTGTLRVQRQTKQAEIPALVELAYRNSRERQAQTNKKVKPTVCPTVTGDMAKREKDREAGCTGVRRGLVVTEGPGQSFLKRRHMNEAGRKWRREPQEKTLFFLRRLTGEGGRK